MVRSFKHAVTGRSMRVRKDSRAERLVEADSNWSEIKSTTKPEKEADNGTGDSGERGGVARSTPEPKRGGTRRGSSRKS